MGLIFGRLLTKRCGYGITGTVGGYDDCIHVPETDGKCLFSRVCKHSLV